MLFSSVLSVAIASALGSEPLPILSDSSPEFSRGVVRLTCDCCGQIYFASF